MICKLIVAQISIKGSEITPELVKYEHTVFEDTLLLLPPKEVMFLVMFVCLSVAGLLTNSKCVSRAKERSVFFWG